MPASKSPTSQTETQKLTQTVSSLTGFKKTRLYKYLSDNCGINERQAFRWVMGKADAQEENLERLKQLASGYPRQISQPQSTDPPGKDVELLSMQLGELRDKVAVLLNDYEKRMTESEKKISQLAEAIRTQAEQIRRLGHNTPGEATG